MLDSDRTNRGSWSLRERAQEELRQSRVLFEKLFECSPDAIIVTGGDGLIKRVNSQAEKMFGYSRGDLVGQSIELLVPERFRRIHVAHREGYSVGPRLRPMGAGYELYATRKDGREFPVDIMLSPVESDEDGLVLAVVRDITERKAAEQALREGRERFRQIAENISEVFYTIDLREHRLVYVSPAFEAIWGQSRDVLYRHADSWLEAVHPEDRGRAARAFERLTTDGVYDQEYRIVRPDGSIRCIWDRAFPVRDESGAVVRAVGIAEDLTERRAASEALRLSEERFRSLVEGVRDHAIFMLDASGQVLSWSRGAERIQGYRAEEIVGQHFSRFYTPEDVERAKPQDLLRNAAAQGQAEDEGWRVRKDGSRFLASVTVTALRDTEGNLRGFSKIMRDITERQRAQEALLLEVTNVLASNLDIRQLLSAIAASLRRIVPHDCADLALFDQASGQLRLQPLDLTDTKGLPGDQTLIPLDGSPEGLAYTSREALLVKNVETHGFPPEIVHLVRGDRVLGTLDVLSFQEAAFTEDEVHLLAQVANLVALFVDNALTHHQVTQLIDRLREEKLYLEDELRTEYNFEEIVGESAALKRILKQLETVAPTEATVLILGETGTGKELIARAIHHLSARRNGTFVKVNCAAIPGGLLESELFGHEKGAFTGAVMQKIGRLELADEGTLFLDEVGDIALEIQPKLLRALQEREFERLGGTRTIPVNVRLIAATNRDLTKMVEERRFRSDLYYWLRVFPLQLPPLRERPEDISVLAHYFTQKHAQRMNRKIESIAPETMNALVRWPWPGNVRELENLIERAVIICRGPVLHIPTGELKQQDGLEAPAPATLEDAEREHILRVLRETKGVVGGPHGAAARLGLKRTTLNSKMLKLGISRRDL